MVFIAYFCAKWKQIGKKRSLVSYKKTLVDVLQKCRKRSGMKGVIISVTKGEVLLADLSQAKVYLSVFPNNKRDELLNGIKSNAPLIRHELAQRTRDQLRRIPNLSFYIDDSLDYIENIDSSLRGKDIDPIKNPDVLDKRKKI